MTRHAQLVTHQPDPQREALARGRHRCSHLQCHVTHSSHCNPPTRPSARRTWPAGDKGARTYTVTHQPDTKLDAPGPRRRRARTRRRRRGQRRDAMLGEHAALDRDGIHGHPGDWALGEEEAATQGQHNRRKRRSGRKVRMKVYIGTYAFNHCHYRRHAGDCETKYRRGERWIQALSAPEDYDYH